MNRTIFIILSGFTAALIITVFLMQKPKTPITPVSKSDPTPTKISTVSIKLKAYNNPSGFGLKYPESYILTEKKVEDQSVYAWILLTDPQTKAITSVKLESSKLVKIDDWVGSGKMKKIKLADLEGREYIDGKKITSIALDQGGVLITIATDILSPVHQQIVSSFVFTQPTQAVTNTSGDGEGDIIFEGEEVVE